MKAFLSRHRHLSFVLLFLLLYFVVYLFLNRSALFSFPDTQSLLDRYQQSTYVRGDKSDVILSDADYYLVRGLLLISDQADLETLPPSHPPLAQYLYGLSQRFFASPAWISLLSAVAVLAVFFILAFYLLGSFGYLAVILFSLEPIFTGDLAATMLDIPLLLFSLISVWFFLRYLRFNRNPAWFVNLSFCHFFLGLAFATKFFPVTLPLFAAFYLATLFTADFRRFLTHTLSLVFIALGFNLGHLSYFFHHLNPLSFIRFQRYVVSWWAGSPQVPPFQVFDLVIRNRWHTWWDSFAVTAAPGWNFTWPLLLLLAAISLPLYYYRRHKLTPQLLLFYSWFIFSFILFSFEAVYPRHLLAILPAMYLLSAFSLKNLFNKST